MKQSWIHLGALGVFVIVGIAWGLVKCGVIGEVPTRIPKNTADLDVLPPEEIPREGVPGFPKRFFDGTGTVRGELRRYPEGTPIEGATIQLSGRPDVRVATGGDGRFTLSGVPAGLDVALRIEPGDGSIEGVTAIPLRQDAEVDLGRLWIGGRTTWSGRISGPKGEPVPGAVVTLHAAHLLGLRAGPVSELPFHRRPPALHRAVTDREGRYVIENVGRDPVGVVVRAAGFVPSIATVSMTAVGSVPPDPADDQQRTDEPDDGVVHDRTLEKGAQISGVVVDAQGRAVTGASLLLLGRTEGDRAVLTARYAATDAKGRFRFTTVRHPDERLVVFAGTTLFTWDERLSDGMIVRLR